MYKINFSVPMLTVENTNSEKMLNMVLAELIGTETEGKTMKLYGWIKSLHVGDPLIVDESDKKDLYDLIDGTTRCYIHVKGQLLSIINAAEPEKRKSTR